MRNGKERRLQPISIATIFNSEEAPRVDRWAAGQYAINAHCAWRILASCQIANALTEDAITPRKSALRLESRDLSLVWVVVA